MGNFHQNFGNNLWNLSAWSLQWAFKAHFIPDHKRAQGTKIKERLTLMGGCWAWDSQSHSPDPWLPWFTRVLSKFSIRLQHSYESYKIGWRVPTKDFMSIAKRVGNIYKLF